MIIAVKLDYLIYILHWLIYCYIEYILISASEQYPISYIKFQYLFTWTDVKTIQQATG